MKRTLATLLLLPMFVACEDSTDPGPDTSHVGVYQLQSVNGEDVPATFEEDGGTFTVVEGTMTLNENGTFALSAELEFTFDGETDTEVVTLSGTYTRSGNTVTFNHDEEGFETATLSGDVLTTTGGGDELLVFEK